MKHPFDNHQLTFSQLKQMIQLLFSGKISQYGQVTQKIDGLHLMISFKDNKIIAARNKSHLKNSAQQALTLKTLPQFFEDLDKKVINNFILPMKDIKKLLSVINKQKLQKIFWNGRRFLSIQLVWKDLTNVIDYFKSVIVFHSLKSFDQQGNQLQQDRKMAMKLARQLRKINIDKKKMQIFDIKQVTPFNIKIQKYEDKVKEYYKKIDDILKQYKLKQNNTIYDYLVRRYQIFVDKLQQQYGITFQKQFKQILINRWGKGEKGFDLTKIKKTLQKDYTKQILDYINNFQKFNNKQSKDKQYIYPIQLIIYEIGVYILSWINNNLDILADNKDETRKQIINDFNKTIKEIKQLNQIDPDNRGKVQKTVYHLSIIDDLGGINKIVPLQGIVYNYKGVLYKLTGIFSSVNQIMGIIKYDR